MGTIIFFIGFAAMIASFTVALIQYNKMQRMDLTVLCFMLSLAVMVSGVTASVLDGKFRKPDPEQATAAEAEQDPDPASAPIMYVSWDESLYGGKASGGKAENTSEEQPQAEGEQPPAEVEQPSAEGEQPPAEGETPPAPQQ